jgi:sialate O-acetylesterase
MYHGVFPVGASKTPWDTMGDAPSWSAPIIRFGPRYYYTESGIAQAKASFAQSYGAKNSGPDAWTKKLVFGPMTEAPAVPDNTLYDGKAADAAIAALRELKGKPFFLGVGFIKPHTPFVAPKKYWDLYDPKKIKLAVRAELPKGAPALAGHNSGEVRRYTDQPKRDPFTEANARNLRHGYFACISYVDAQVGRVLAELDRLGLRENTIVLLYGDHGWHLGDHGLWGKITNFEIAARAPLIISAPGIAANRKSMALTEFLDIYPTLAELADLPVGKQLEGRSLVPVLRDPARGHKPAAFTQQYRGKATGYSIRTERRRYTEWIENGRVIARELYDYAIDPGETMNLTAQSKHAEFARRLSRQLRKGLNLPPRFARAFGSHMVLQQGQPLPVWGTAKPAAKVIVTLGNQKQTATADADGNWKVNFPAAKTAGQTLALTAQTAQHKTTLTDIVVGEVWLCAGQSNMEWKLSQAATAKTAVPAAKLSRLRLLNFVGAARGGSGDYTPELIARLSPERFCEGQWRVCSPENAASFSAVGFFFGQKLLAEIDVPVGLINVSIGGTPAEAWVRRKALAAHPQLAAIVRGNWLENKSLEPWCRERGASNLKRALAAGDFIPGDDLGPNHSFKPAFMWDAAVAPFQLLPIAGVLWYQGESNAESEWRVKQHDAVFKTLVTDWRAQWKRPKLPFLFVQLPAMKRPHWPAFRASQQRVHDSLPHTGMVVTIDLGHPTNVHPREKQPVGERLERLAMAHVYGKPNRGRGPRFESAKQRGDLLVVRLAKGNRRLRTLDELPPTGFEVRDGRGRWSRAEARIVVGDILEVASPLGQAVTALRYAWVPYPEPTLNLMDETGLPVAPFETELSFK